MKTPLTLLALVLALPCGIVHAQDTANLALPAAVPDVPDEIDLGIAINYAVENSFAIRQARERIREQEGLIVEVKARALPGVNLVGSYTRKDDRLVQANFGSNQDWTIALEARQALYAGGGISAALGAQKYLREAALLELKSIINATLLEVRVRYYDVLLAQQQISVQEQNVELLRETLTNARNRLSAGSVSDFEVLRAEVELANAQPALIRARNRSRTSVDQLRRAIGFLNNTPENLRKTPKFVGSLDFAPVAYELQPALDAARTSRPELQRLEQLARARETNIVAERAGSRPTVDLVGGYQVVKKSTSDQFKDSLDGWVIGVQSSWAIFDGRRTAGKVAQARSQLRQAELALNEQRLEIEVQVRTALSGLQEAAELAEAAQKVVAQAEEALRLATARYGAGSATQLDVLQARVSLTQSRTNQLEANYSYNVAVANVRQAIGQADTYLEPAK